MKVRITLKNGAVYEGDKVSFIFEWGDVMKVVLQQGDWKETVDTTKIFSMEIEP